MLAPTLGGCGFSEQFNSGISAQERNLESEAARQVLQQSDLIVQKSHEILPASDAPISIAVPHSKCNLELLHTATDLSLTLTTPQCAIEAPSAGQITVAMSLVDLTFNARRSPAGLIALDGSGHLSLSAQLPVIGDYSGVASYKLLDSSIDTVSQSVSLHITLDYESGASSTKLDVRVGGTRQSITGSIVSPNLRCTVSGSLDVPTIKCQLPDGTPLN